MRCMDGIYVMKPLKRSFPKSRSLKQKSLERFFLHGDLRKTTGVPTTGVPQFSRSRAEAELCRSPGDGLDKERSQRQKRWKDDDTGC